MDQSNSGDTLLDEIKQNSVSVIDSSMGRVKSLVLDANNNFKDPNLLSLIKAEFDKDHVGDDRSKLFVFCSELSGKLPPRYRFSIALLGDSSEGKTNIWRVTVKYLPSGWYLELSRITSACIEDELDLVDIIFFQEINEKGLNSSIIETVKAMVEDGLNIMKKDPKTNYKTTIKKNMPRKVGIYSTTGNIYDDEMANRYCIVPIVGHPEKYKKVNKLTKETAGDPKKEIAMINRGEMTSWITEGLKTLKNFDIITIPNATMIETNEDSPRSMRDLKRFLNLVRVLAWLHQKQRYSEETDKHSILYATPEDVYNAYEIGAEIFNQSYSQMDNRSKETLQAIMDLVKECGEENQDFLQAQEDYQYIRWIDRADLQRKLKLKSVNGVKKRLRKLSDLGYVRYYTPKNGNKSFICLSPHLSPTYHSTYHLPITERFLTMPHAELYEKMTKLVIGKSGANDRQVTGKVIGKKTTLLSIKDGLPITKYEKIAECNDNNMVERVENEKKVIGNSKCDDDIDADLRELGIIGGEKE